MPASLNDLLIAERVGIDGSITVEDVVKLVPIVQQISGQFLLDPNEFNGWGAIGMFDNTNTQDLGNVGAAVNRVAGGISFPFDVTIVRFAAWHRDNNAAILPWGWRIARQSKTAGSNAVTFLNMLDEVGDNGGAGPRNYGNNQNQRTDISSFTNAIIPAGEVVVLGVEAPTAVTTNRYVQVMSGYLQFSRV